MWIIGDIHGCSDELQDLLREIPAADPLIFLGDYIDRGPGSAAVIDLAIREARRSRFLLGNHESMMLNYFLNPDSDEAKSWLHPLNGGQTTLRSYGLTPMSDYQDIPQVHRDFLEALVLYVEEDDFIAVHAGLSVTEPDLSLQKREDLLWIRDAWIRAESNWTGKKVYYGHTPTRYIHGLMNQSELIIGRRSVGLDTGCVYGGYLTAMHARTGETIQIPARKNYWI